MSKKTKEATIVAFACPCLIYLALAANLQLFRLSPGAAVCAKLSARPSSCAQCQKSQAFAEARHFFVRCLVFTSKEASRDYSHGYICLGTSSEWRQAIAKQGLFNNLNRFPVF